MDSSLDDDVLGIILGYLDFGTRESILEAKLAKRIKYEKPEKIPEDLTNLDLNNFGYGLQLGIEKESIISDNIELYSSNVDVKKLVKTNKKVIHFKNVGLIIPYSFIPEKYEKKNRKPVTIIIESDCFPTFFKNCQGFNFCDYFTVDRLILKQLYSSIADEYKKGFGRCEKINSVFPIVNQLEFHDHVWLMGLNNTGLPLCKTIVINCERNIGFDMDVPKISAKNLFIYVQKISINYNFCYQLEHTYRTNIENVEFQYNHKNLVIRKIGEKLKKLSLIYNGNRDPVYDIQTSVLVIELILTYNSSNLSDLKIETPDLRWFPNLEILKINMSVKPRSFEIVGDIQNRKVYFSQIKPE